MLLVMNKKRAVVIAALIFTGIVFFVLQQGRQQHVPAGELFEKALENTKNSQSFCFRIQAEMGENGTVTTVIGKRAAPDRVELKGSIMGTRLELVQVGEVTYLKEPASKKWFTLKGNDMVNSELFSMELNPLGTFDFKDILDINYVRKDKIDGKKLLLVEMRPVVKNNFLTTRYGEFDYQVWIDPRKKLIYRAAIMASGNKQDDRLKIGIELWDFDREVKISPPKKSSAPGS